MSKLSQILVPIYELELKSGNEVERVDEPAGTKCPYAVVFKRPLHRQKIEDSLSLGTYVTYWESRDPHYAIEAGYRCAATGHAIAGPLIP